MIALSNSIHLYARPDTKEKFLEFFRAFDTMKRHLPEQRGLPAGDSALCPGKAAGRFHIRTQQWEVVQLRSNPHANCKVEILPLLEGLPEWSLLLFESSAISASPGLMT